MNKIITDGSTITSARRDAPVACSNCRKLVRRKARQQMYCSARCRRNAHHAKRVARGDFNCASAWDSAHRTNPPKNDNPINGLQGPKAGSTPLNLLGGYRWPGAASVAPELRRAILTAEVGGQP
jgi:hypothetical protein